MNNFIYQNNLIDKKQLKQLLTQSFSSYGSIKTCLLSDELKYLGFKYATQAGISISIEDLKIPFSKNLIIEQANQAILKTNKIYLQGRITNNERFQKIIDTWNLTSKTLKEQIINYFKKHDPLNSVYMMAFSGARGNLSQVRQLVGMRGLMSDPKGEIINLPIKKNFREGLTITDYLISGYGARKGIVDTALRTANSGYLTRRLIDVAQDILIREKDCKTIHSIIFEFSINNSNLKILNYNKILGRVLNKSIFDPKTQKLIAKTNTLITFKLIKKFKKKKIKKFYIRTPLTCNLYRALCQQCYGWNLSNENLIDIGEAVGIIAGQSIGEPGTQLTMRTFHTGGTFKTETQQQIISPVNGIIKFHKTLKTKILRTNCGETVFLTINSSFLVLIPENKTKELIKIKILQNLILFVQNNQYIKKNTIIGELLIQNKQNKLEIKPILTDKCGEIIIPQLKKNINSLINNKLVWVLSGQLYNSPFNVFINFYSDYKINKYSYIFRTKLINYYNGFIKFIYLKNNLFQTNFKLLNNKYSLINANLYKFTKINFQKNYLLTINSLKFLIKLNHQNSKNYLQITKNKELGTLISQSFQTLTGGTLYYNINNLIKPINSTQNILFYTRLNLNKKYISINYFQTLIWLEEENYKININQKFHTLLIKNGQFINKGTKITSHLISKTSGIINIKRKNNLFQILSIKSGLIYKIKNQKDIIKNLYFPGEMIFSNIIITKLSYCNYLNNKNKQVLICPILFYEIPYFNEKFLILKQTKSNLNSNINLLLKKVYPYKSNQQIGTKINLYLLQKNLILQLKNSLKNDISIQLTNNNNNKLINFYITENFILNNYLSALLKYKNLQSCFLIQQEQFIDCYTILGYLETVTLKSLEIIKFKLKKYKTKQFFLISNNDCIKIKKTKFIKKNLHDFIINSTNINQTGKIIIEKKDFFIIQKGHPYFFPKCINFNSKIQTNLQYKFIPSNFLKNNLKKNKIININFYNLLKFSLFKPFKLKNFLKKNKIINKIEFSELFIKKNQKLYGSLLPQFSKEFLIKNTSNNIQSNLISNSLKLTNSSLKKLNYIILIKNTIFIENKYKKIQKIPYQLSLIKFKKYPFHKSTKFIGFYSIFNDSFEQISNKLICKNNTFIEADNCIGLLNFKKEITGDIVQGLPQIEEILEARKKNLNIKSFLAYQKKEFLIQKVSLNPNFEFKNLGTTLKKNEKINPHKLLKIYFNYYGNIKLFYYNSKNIIKFIRLLNNYEGVYKSFKKIQLFILKSIQLVYKSQGVSINDKHLEIIIKQMTIKVLITFEGNSPLLKHELIDLYHIHYINQILKNQKKESANYIPILLGITKASLNNPSFISAASFQETTQILTKAAMEGQIDWLRGLKENIIIGHLIPTGTGFPTYYNCFIN